MKERPILMNTENVKAILDGRKTQTRRVIKPQPDFTEYPDGKILPYEWSEWMAKVKCPYGQVGDRLWVRETVVIDGYLDLYYKVDNTPLPTPPNDWKGYRGGEWVGNIPSIHMSKWMTSRWLEITEVRVERVQEITEEDVKADFFIGQIVNGRLVITPATKETAPELWDSINAKRGYGWEVNPWVWVISFRRLIDGK